MIAPPIAAATDWIRMSRLLDVRELVREHPAQLVLGEEFGDPRVTATAACLGLRPVAKALGWSWGMM